MNDKIMITENVQDICNRQIAISLKAEQNIINSVPLKKLVGFAAYDGNGYSKDEASVLLSKEQLNKVNPARSYGEIGKR
ncbi:hypothetical protein [Flavobacterium granuli]|uniref:Uncharacterized protein n=1 Tax=Flavobacterium granuli TaxID=280093 RepID=A0ABU1S0G9_9FLAO|nr:hypothetical protein [Flavobacterium granuli]MDR6844517.1 hypothetical protein [Flavobacterium granuli]